MGLIWFGTKQANIGIDEFLYRCPVCEDDTFSDIMITSNYFHIYYIPIFPVDKEASIVCQKCGCTRHGMPFTAKNFKNFQEIKSKFRHPLYTYFFVALIVIVSIIGILFSV